MHNTNTMLEHEVLVSTQDGVVDTKYFVCQRPRYIGKLFRERKHGLYRHTHSNYVEKCNILCKHD